MRLIVSAVPAVAAVVAVVVVAVAVTTLRPSTHASHSRHFLHKLIVITRNHSPRLSPTHSNPPSPSRCLQHRPPRPTPPSPPSLSILPHLLFLPILHPVYFLLVIALLLSFFVVFS